MDFSSLNHSSIYVLNNLFCASAVLSNKYKMMNKTDLTFTHMELSLVRKEENKQANKKKNLKLYKLLCTI